MADKLRSQLELEQLQARYVGTAHTEFSKYDWLSNIHRDTNASIIGHPALLNYHAVATGLTRSEVRTAMIEAMILPCGPPPEKQND